MPPGVMQAPSSGARGRRGLGHGYSGAGARSWSVVGRHGAGWPWSRARHCVVTEYPREYDGLMRSRGRRLRVRLSQYGRPWHAPGSSSGSGAVVPAVAAGPGLLVVDMVSSPRFRWWTRTSKVGESAPVVKVLRHAHRGRGVLLGCQGGSMPGGMHSEPPKGCPRRFGSAQNRGGFQAGDALVRG